MKKKIIILCSIILIVVISGAGMFWQSFKKSYKYSCYQMAIAMKNNDIETYLSYFDFDSIVNKMFDAQMAEMEKSLAGNPFGFLGTYFIQSLKPELSKALIEETKEEFVNNKDIIKVNKFAVFYSICFNKPLAKKVITDKKIDNNTMEIRICGLDNKNCYSQIFENKGGKWIITEFIMPTSK